MQWRRSNREEGQVPVHGETIITRLVIENDILRSPPSDAWCSNRPKDPYNTLRERMSFSASLRRGICYRVVDGLPLYFVRTSGSLPAPTLCYLCAQMMKRMSYSYGACILVGAFVHHHGPEGRNAARSCFASLLVTST